ncbi:hypothetical protein RN001_012901 [Aquatica leii]|uniref:Uncharacterized protein n=1 Tax=Aquatica leii TaxID=1421715 RepID=A0AAN7SFG0_9COLE|nr:hypothetical protein RN001_012901 [Aquatica leii]
MYRNTPHCSTGETPSKRMFNRNINTIINKGGREVSFNKNEEVYVRDYRLPNKKSWIKATIDEVLGARTYWVKLENGTIWKRHTDQIIKIGDYCKNNDVQDKNPTLSVEQEMQKLRPFLLSQTKDIACSTQEIETNDSCKEKVTDHSCNSPVRRSHRIRKAPDRLDL